MADQAGYTRIPNALLELLATLPEAEVRVLLAIVRKTAGWQKECDVISYSQLEVATGMSRQGVINGIEAAMRRGILTRKPAKNNGFCYQVVYFVDQSTSLTSLPSRPLVVNEVDHSSPQVVNEVDTQKKDLKERERKGDRAGAKAPRAPRKKSDKPTTPSGIIKALAKACQIDQELAPKKTHILLAQTAGKLYAAGQKREQTEQQIIDTIAYVAGYFAKEDWRGKKGEPPTPSTLLEVWSRAIEARSRPVATPGANIPVIHASEAPAPRRKTQEELDEIYFKVNGHYPKRRLNA